jgi:hypothetical protein
MLSVRLPNDPKGWEVEQKRLNACTKNIQISHYICHYAFQLTYWVGGVAQYSKTSASQNGQISREILKNLRHGQMANLVGRMSKSSAPMYDCLQPSNPSRVSQPSIDSWYRVNQHLSSSDRLLDRHSWHRLAASTSSID